MLMPRLYLILNHNFTNLQEKDAKESLGIQSIVNIPQHLSKLWQNIPPDLSEIDAHIEPIKHWLVEQAHPSDYVLIQGDFGATFILVKFALCKQLVPIYSTTNREAVEEQQNGDTVKLTRYMRHHRFRKYGV